MYFTGAAGGASCDLSSPWRGPFPLSFTLSVPYIIISHENLKDGLLKLPQITFCWLSWLVQSPVLHGLLGKGPTLIDCAVSCSHSCRKLARPKDEDLKTSPEVLPWDMRAFMLVCEWLRQLLFCSHLLFFKLFHSLHTQCQGGSDVETKDSVVWPCWC